jgi:hypothetical protein
MFAALATGSCTQSNCYTLPAQDASAKEASISFLEKRNKKLLPAWLTRTVRSERNESNKSFLVLFFKKNCFLGACLHLAVSCS